MAKSFVSKEDIIDILERDAMHGHSHICLPRDSERFTNTRQNQILKTELI